MSKPISPDQLDHVCGGLKTAGQRASTNVIDCRGTLCRDHDGSINWGETWNQLGAERDFYKQLESIEFPPLPPSKSNPHK